LLNIKIKRETGHFHEKIQFLENVALWGHFKTLNILKNVWTFFEPISTGNC